MAIVLEDLKDAKQKQRRRLAVSILLVSIAIHVVAAIGAGIWIVAKWEPRPEMVFEAKNSPKFPPKIIDPEMAAVEFEAAASPPVLDEKIASLREAEFALPDLPQIPVDPAAEYDPSVAMSDLSLGMDVGLGGLGAGGMGGGGKSAVSFFGIQDTAERVVIVFDVSGSVVNKAKASGVSVSRIKEEAQKMIDGLSINTAFGLVQFVRNYKVFRADMVSASDPNKVEAKRWIEKEFITSGSMPASRKGVIRKKPNGIESVFDAVFDWEADVVYVISDGSFWRDPGNQKVPYNDLARLIRERQKGRVDPMKIHFIGFQMKPDERKALTRIVRRTGGILKEL